MNVDVGHVPTALGDAVQEDRNGMPWMPPKLSVQPQPHVQLPPAQDINTCVPATDASQPTQSSTVTTVHLKALLKRGGWSETCSTSWRSRKSGETFCTWRFEVFLSHGFT